MEDAFQSDTCAERLKALGDPTRLRIIDALRAGELTVSDLAEILEIEIVMVSHHLQILKHAKLVEARRDGRFMCYSLPTDLFKKSKVGSSEVFNLGCCRIEIPKATS